MSDSSYGERRAHPGRFRCCGVLIDGLAPEAATQALLTSRHGTARRIHLCDTVTLAHALRDAEFRDLLNAARLNLPADNRLVRTGRQHGHGNLTGRIDARDLMLATLSQGREQGLKHFLYGHDQATVERLHKNLETRLPGVDIVGTGSFTHQLSPDEAEELTDLVRAAAPDLVWVGLDTPLKDGFVAAYAARFAATLVPVGRVFEQLAGRRPASGGRWRRHLLGSAVYYYGTLTDGRRSRRLDREAAGVATSAGPSRR